MLDKILQNKADILKALAHPTRLNIIESLRNGERCVCEIIDHVNIEQSNVSQHLAVLKKLDILTSHKDGLKVIYRVKHQEIFQILNLLESLISNEMEEKMAILDGIRRRRAGGE